MTEIYFSEKKNLFIHCNRTYSKLDPVYVVGHSTGPLFDLLSGADLTCLDENQLACEDLPHGKNS